MRGNAAGLAVKKVRKYVSEGEFVVGKKCFNVFPLLIVAKFSVLLPTTNRQ